MLVYRITLAKWAGVLTASGQPARWNSRGTFVLYTASSRALACLENVVHLSGERTGLRYKITEIEIPDSCSKHIILPAALPKGWHKPGNYHLCQPFGDDWAAAAKSLVLVVPSAIIQDEQNILINTAHPQLPLVSVTDIRDFTFDERL
ncbi:MAG: RES family NAD+ phosphorylase [Candidatus Cyclonatronum sp.]|uniref:RES family NAD+ phosphorylase n=1 Tax=Cyclonatronum sp. TaxID=3024185 RepID=UPI0025BA150C|nr:RES family NAD+ phosphorylase [Cyclonatronum sp.]MCC5932725.1 RES family NAD+ phosphorylase [Balneolales bacterium]MCH8485697.1 RES family NAD+ phosphorylase [Cyclonatronum sp.]